jgi:GNAT superfamily N-acetyltransferase
VVIRAAEPGERERLREIAIASKAHWGYDEEQVRRWGEGLELSPGVDRFVAEVDGEVVAYASLVCEDDVCVLDELWVEPEWIGKGVGSGLFRFALARAREGGARRLEWEAEPNAVGFYERMGGRYLRDSEPSAWGRVTPVMGIDLGRR